VISYLRTTLAVVVRLLARRLGTLLPISPIRPFLPHDFRRVDFATGSSPVFRIELATSSTPSELPTRATPHHDRLRPAMLGCDPRCLVKAPAAGLAWTVHHHTESLTTSQWQRLSEEGEAARTMGSSNPFTVVLPRLPL